VYSHFIENPPIGSWETNPSSYWKWESMPPFCRWGTDLLLSVWASCSCFSQLSQASISDFIFDSVPLCHGASSSTRSLPHCSCRRSDHVSLSLIFIWPAIHCASPREQRSERPLMWALTCRPVFDSFVELFGFLSTSQICSCFPVHSPWVDFLIDRWPFCLLNLGLC
jgi:hypothetical protein